MDREKLIKGLESLRDIRNAKSNMAIGNGKVAWAGYANTADDALSMLKEQEAVEPKVSCSEQRCGNCNKIIEMDGWKACPWCGKMIDWERWWQKNGTRNQDT